MKCLSLTERSVFFVRRLFQAPLIILLTAGCGTLQNGHRWGEDATLLPGSDRIVNAASSAVREPATWIPAIGAAVFSIGKFDHRVSNWASKKTPVFGSMDRAGKASDALDAAAGAGFFLPRWPPQAAPIQAIGLYPR
jgi:hypothetical protein